MVGTGYGLESDRKHGMYQGPDLTVQGVSYGLYEYRALGDHPSLR
jgi:hypothetical protein